MSQPTTSTDQEAEDSAVAHGAFAMPGPCRKCTTARVGVTRENVNRALSRLVADGSIRQEGGRYVLVDEERLRRDLARDWPLAARRDRRLTVPPAGDGVL